MMLLDNLQLMPLDLLVAHYRSSTFKCSCVSRLNAWLSFTEQFLFCDWLCLTTYHASAQIFTIFIRVHLILLQPNIRSIGWSQHLCVAWTLKSWIGQNFLFFSINSNMHFLPIRFITELRQWCSDGILELICDKDLCETENWFIYWPLCSCGKLACSHLTYQKWCKLVFKIPWCAQKISLSGGP